MTDPRSSAPHGARSEPAAGALRRLLRRLEAARRRGASGRLTLGRGAESTLDAGLLAVLCAAVRLRLGGRTALVVPADQTLSPGEAAELLNVSPAFVLRLLERGELPAHRTGADARLPLEDVLAYRRRLKQRQDAALDYLTAQTQALERDRA